MSSGEPFASTGPRNAFVVGAVLLAAVYVVVRPLANQFEPYGAETALAGLVAVGLALFTTAAVFSSKLRPRAPENLVLAVVLWLGVVAWGALRSPHPGAGIPHAGDLAAYALLLLCGYFLARTERGAFELVCRLTIAMAAVEAFSGVWQYFIDFPRMWADVSSGREVLPDQLQSSLGLRRFQGDNVFGTFVYPNSLSAFLMIGILLLGGVALRPPAGPSSGTRPLPGFTWARTLVIIMLLAAMFAALKFTDSKGAWVALLFGAWFLFAHRRAERFPQQAGALRLASIVLVAAVVALLAAGLFGWLGPRPFGLSMHVRFEYWKPALSMLSENPLQGVGLAGFPEHYTFFKTAQGMEVKEAHNDHLQLLAELGILGPLAYLMLWRVVLGARSSATAPVPAASAPLEKLGIAGGLLGFFLMFAAFQPLNVTDFVALLSGNGGGNALAGTFHTLAMPAIFVAVMIALRPKADAGALTYAARAAIGALLIHQLVDFDLKAQAVIGTACFMGGMLIALRQPDEEPASIGALERFSRVIPALLALALFPLLVWIPLQSAVPRAAADNAEDEARQLQSDEASSQQHAREIVELRRHALEQREAAAAAAPFDAQAWIDLAFAYELLPASAEDRPTLTRRANDAFVKAEELRPLSHIPKLLRANFHMKHDDFERAQSAYTAARARYPRHPGLCLWEGDAALLAGNTDRAVELWLLALQTDIGLDDHNVRIVAAFSDPRAGVFPRHGHDADVLQKIDQALAGSLSRQAQQAMFLRRMVSLAGLLRKHEQSKIFTEDAVTRVKEDLLRSGESLVNLTPDATERARTESYLTNARKTWGEKQPAVPPRQ